MGNNEEELYDSGSELVKYELELSVWDMTYIYSFIIVYAYVPL